MSHQSPPSYEQAGKNQHDAYWMPFTPNRAFKADPRMLVSAKGIYYTTSDGRKLIDGTAGHASVNAGHCRPEIITAIHEQVKTLDYAPAFRWGHPRAFEFANRLADIAPDNLNRVFFTNSGSEAIDTALKVALAYQQARGQAQRNRLVGRALAYHGVSFGAISVSGLGDNRKQFSALLPHVDHLPHTHGLAENLFSHGQPQHGSHFADALEDIIHIHGAETIAAVIVEPVTVATGIFIAPEGYLQRLREICNRHDILLIFDEVITGFGRIGARWACERFNVIPDIITSAKALTNSTLPMGATIVREEIYETINNSAQQHAIEFFHGYTTSGHPLACAAGIANLDIFAQEKLFTRASGEMEKYFEDKVHGLRDIELIRDLRNIGFLAAFDLTPQPDQVGKHGQYVVAECFKRGLLLRAAGDIAVLSPPLTITKAQIDDMFAILREVLQTLQMSIQPTLPNQEVGCLV